MAHSHSGALSLNLLLRLGVNVHKPGQSILACYNSLAETPQLVRGIKLKQNQLEVNLHLLAAGTERL